MRLGNGWRARRAVWLVVACVAVCGVVAAAQGRGARRRVETVPQASVILGRPTDHSIAVSLLFPAAVEARIEYGRAGVMDRMTTPPARGRAGEPFEVTLDGLAPNTRYAYRVATRQGGAEAFVPGVDGTFMTARAAGAVFSFGVQGDSHPERDQRMYDAGLYARTMDLVRAEQPDLYFMLGDDFSIEREIANGTLSQDTVNAVYAGQRPFLGRMAGSTSLFHVNGNHEEAGRFLLNGTPNSAPVFAGVARNRYLPLPAPDGFYTGDTERIEPIGLLRDYYAFTWGDALFVTIDPYWHSTVQVDADPGGRGGGGGGGGGRAGGRGGGGGGGRGGGGNAMNAAGLNRNLWSVTIGDAQYAWLKRTLETSTAKYKFVFAHHVLGTGRGAVEIADSYEWGGRDPRGGKTFAEMRPNWTMPIHQLFVKTGVTIFFQGHDHLFARQEKDGVIYQEVPNPADLTYTAFNRDAYRSGDILPNAGHLLVTVSPEDVRVEYRRSYLPQDETAQRTHGEVAFSYRAKARGAGNGPGPVATGTSGRAGAVTTAEDGTVADAATGLMWQADDSGELTWEGARDYARTLRLAGHDDWRLPTARELFTILDHSRNPALDPSAFRSTGAEYWWSSETLVSDASRVWVANAGGGIGPHPRAETLSAGGRKRFHARCVRGGPAPAALGAPRFVASADGTVTDRTTGLIWQRADAGREMDWAEAQRYAADLSLGGATGWRLPTIVELQSLNDTSRVSPSIDLAAFPGTTSARYWSSTTLFSRDTARAWFLEFRAGIASYDAKTVRYAVRCVRR